MRTLALLEHFRRTKASASAAELASALSMPQSSTSVLLKTLVSLNYLEYEARLGDFCPAIASHCWETGSRTRVSVTRASPVSWTCFRPVPEKPSCSGNRSVRRCNTFTSYPECMPSSSW
ncbi:helix-turn-helix domain-containing protein [Bradyrhizobium sp. Cp5.3]|uniref:helix-turn-helix domain-containing protein n=1 Tax=Bradyrhizobium sp. Cp5.3 TaxID=443598 RepID=UPI001FD9AE42|nr:helix-turn-helix domain-containing protein [Bradyrhizobium sp. Cp5.3]